MGSWLKVREQTLRYAKTKKAKMLREEEELEKKINILQKQIDSGCNNTNEKLLINIQLDQKTNELENIIEHRTRGTILRAKCRWYNEGEKNTKYFLSLEKRHYKNGVISQLKLGDNEFASSDKEILSECETFYRDIYRSKADCDNSRISETLISGFRPWLKNVAFLSSLFTTCRNPIIHLFNPPKICIGIVFDFP